MIRKKIFNNKEIENLFKELGNKHGLIREKARKKIALLGTDAVNQLADLLSNKNKILRWEAVKTLIDISDPDTIPLFLLALQDEDVDVRWVAAEGIISFGNKGIIAMLEALISNPDSFYLRKGAHHIIREYLKVKPVNELNSLFKALGSIDAELKLSKIIFKTLKSVKIKKSREKINSLKI